MSDVIFESDHLRITEASGSKVAVQTGSPPEDETPTLVDGAELNVALRGYLNSPGSDGGGA